MQNTLNTAAFEVLDREELMKIDGGKAAKVSVSFSISFGKGSKSSASVGVKISF